MCTALDDREAAGLADQSRECDASHDVHICTLRAKSLCGYTQRQRVHIERVARVMRYRLKVCETNEFIVLPAPASSFFGLALLAYVHALEFCFEESGAKITTV